MNYKESREYIKSISKYGSVLGLDSIQSLLEKLNNPHEKLRVVHVAGTNGKGSVIAYLESILICAGYKVGKYTSPAVFDYRECFQINGRHIDKDVYAECMSQIKVAADNMVKEGQSHPTPFEVETALAFMYFNRSDCDVVLLETGMGGETDATNVMAKVECSVITSISLDHMSFLGDTVEEIARVKAGIVKEKCDTVLYRQNQEVMNVVEQVCQEKESQLSIVGVPENISVSEDGCTVFDYTRDKSVEKLDGCGEEKGTALNNIKIRMPGMYQPYNAVTAIETAYVLQKKGFEILEYIQEGLEKAKLCGRFETIMDKPRVIIDGAHNPGAAEKLKSSIEMYFTNKRITFIMGVLADKDYDKVAKIMAPLAESVVTVTPNNPRALAAESLKNTVSKYNRNVTAAESIEKALNVSMEKVINKETDVIVAFGSLSYLGELRRVANKYKNS